jgi:hypothetical protein
MKKSLTVLLFLIVSQIGFSQGISGGIFISPVVSWFKPDVKTIKADYSRLSFGFGVPITFDITKNFGICTGFNFVNVGGGLQYLDSIPKFYTEDSTYHLLPNSKINYKTQFIELPLTLVGKTNQIGYITYYLKTGICPALRYKAKGDITVNSDDNIRDEVRGSSLSFLIGGGIEYSLGGSTRVMTEIMFTNGLTDFTKTQTWNKKTNSLNSSSDRVILNSVALRVGVLF